MGDIQWPVHRAIVGFRKLTEGDAAKWVPGEAIAFRSDGNEVLFAEAPVLPENPDPVEVPKAPLAWIPLAEFAVNPLCLNHAEDFLEEADEELPSIPQRGGPSTKPPIRRRQ